MREKRAAHNAAELVLVQRVFAGRKEVGRVKIVVADEFKRVAVVLVGAGLGDHVHKAARVFAAARAKV